MCSGEGCLLPVVQMDVAVDVNVHVNVGRELEGKG